MLYEPKIRVTGSFRKLLHILYERSYRFHPDIQPLCIFSPTNGPPQYEISNNLVCASTKGLDQPAHMRSLIRAFASRLKTIDRLAFGDSKLKRRPHRLVWAYSYQNATLSMCGSRAEIGGPNPPGKSQVIVIWVSIEISIWTLPGKSWTPWKMCSKTIGPPL